MGNLVQLEKEYIPFSNYLHVFRNKDLTLHNRIRDIVIGERDKYSADGKDITSEWDQYELLKWEYPEIQQLKLMFQEAVASYLSRANQTPSEYKMESWCNIRNKGSRHPAHIHEHAALILNYYVSTPPSSAIVFHNPVKAMAYIDWAEKWAPFEFELPVEEGMLVVSPGWLVHEVPYRHPDSTGDRISISCNIAALKTNPMDSNNYNFRQ
jgi:uncharacterized protein (TIGR02466 family)